MHMAAHEDDPAHPPIHAPALLPATPKIAEHPHDPHKPASHKPAALIPITHKAAPVHHEHLPAAPEPAAPAHTATHAAPAKPKLAPLGPSKTPSLGSGQPLPPHIQEAIQNSLMVDLSSVRLHASTAAERKAESLSARAFTFGNDIFLGHGEHPTDLTLISHEAAHVIQQQHTAPVIQTWSSDRSDRYEREADQAAAAVAGGHSFQVRERVDSPRVQRFGISDALDWLADKANNIPGFRMFTVVLGVNPINMETVERTPANVLRAVVEFIPGGHLITQALDKYGVFDKVGNWVSEQIDKLGMVGSSIKKALMDFLDSLSWRDIFHLGDLWDRAKRIFTDPIDRIIDFVKGLVEGIWKFVRDAILKPIAKLAEGTSGWPLLIAVMGKNPITGEPVPQTPDALIGGFMHLIHEDEIWENIKKANAVTRAFAWFKSVLSGLLGFVSQIPDLFIKALKSLEWSDILDLPGGFMKIVGVFGKFLVNFISWAGGKVWDLLKIIFEVVAPKVMPYLLKVGAAFKKILKDPLGFVRHLIDAALLGLNNFLKNFGEHLKKALLGWLVGALPGIYIPKAFTLSEFGMFVLSILGITWAQIRAKIVKALGPNGETIMKGLETTFDIVMALLHGGPAAAWELIKEKLTNLKDMVVDGIVGLVTDTIIKKAIPKLIAMFIPGAGFISAIISIYDAIMTFVEKLSKIVAAVKAFVDSIVAIANGQIAGAAAKVESGLETMLSLTISFLASFFGLGGVANKVMEFIKKLQGMVDKGLDTAIAWIVDKAKKLWGSAKTTAKKAVQSIMDWWKVKQPFQAEDGSSHTLLFKGEGETAQLVFETTPTQLLPFLANFKKPNDSQKKLISEISAAITAIDGIRTVKPKDPTAAQEADVQKNRDAVAASLLTISDKLGKLLGKKDWGTKDKPLPLSYPKPPISAYRTLYFGPKSDKHILQADLEKAQNDKTARNALAEYVAPGDKSVLKKWEKDGSIQTFTPTGSPKPLPEGGGPLGVTSPYQTHVGMKFMLPQKAPGGTPGGYKINEPLKLYGYDSAKQQTDGDHVLEIQLGGVNELENLWPLDKRINQQAGSRLNNAKLPKPDGTTTTMDELKAEAQKPSEVWLVIAATEN